jgi:RNA polymerase sigma factor (sigma-70 family)
MAVVANLCHDWRRRQRGRVRPVRSVSRLPELDQHVYRCIFVGGMSRAECAASLAPRFPSLTETVVADISARLFRILTPQQRWHLGARAQVPGRLPRNGLPDDEEPAWQVATQEPGPGDLVEELQEQQRLREALSQLPADQRLLLRLRYEQGLTLAEVARLTRQPDPFRANRRIQAALDALGSLMGAGRSGPGRKNR